MGFRVQAWGCGIPERDSGTGFHSEIPERDSGPRFQSRIPERYSGVGFRSHIPDGIPERDFIARFQSRILEREACFSMAALGEPRAIKPILILPETQTTREKE